MRIVAHLFTSCKISEASEWSLRVIRGKLSQFLGENIVCNMTKNRQMLFSDAGICRKAIFEDAMVTKLFPFMLLL